MNYQQTLDYMFSALPMYQRQGKTAFKKDLSNIVAFAQELGHPEKKFKSIHVAGTNGKGSTSHMLAAMLQQAGYKVGLYTSPHLKDFRERIRISGELISEKKVIDFIGQHQDFIDRIKPSFFEMTVALAFDHFANEKVDIAVIEVGLGGRLDSTNIILPELSIITNIGFDHMEMLGDTLEKIASEKAGIIKSHVPVVVGEYQNETAPVFEDKAKSLSAPLIYAEKEELPLNVSLNSDLKGTYQLKNARTAVTAINTLHALRTWTFDLKEAYKGLEQVVELTGLKGRWQQLSSSPLTICDTGHNNEAFNYILPALEKLNKGELWMILGFVNDKNVSDLLASLPKTAHYVFTESKVPRAMKLEYLQAEVAKRDMNAIFIKDVNEAIKEVNKKASNDDVIFIGGSTFVVAEIDGL